MSYEFTLQPYFLSRLKIFNNMERKAYIYIFIFQMFKDKASIYSQFELLINLFKEASLSNIIAFYQSLIWPSYFNESQIGGQ